MSEPYLYEDLFHWLSFGRLPISASLWGWKKRQNFLKRDSLLFKLEAKEIQSTASVMVIYKQVTLISELGKRERVWREYPPPDKRKEIIQGIHIRKGHLG